MRISDWSSDVCSSDLIAKAKGAKRAVLLPVSAPFHCSLMAPAADVMAEALAAVTVAMPEVPLVANVTASRLSDPDETRRKLVEQVTGMVRWREAVAYMAAQGVEAVIDRKSVVEGKSGSVRLEPGGRRFC